jgi:hypothetical protein
MESGVNAPDGSARGGKGTAKHARERQLTIVSSTGGEFRLRNFAGIFTPNKQPVFVVAMRATALPPAILDKRSLPCWLIDGEGDQLRSEWQVSCRLRWYKYSTANSSCQGRFAPRLRARWLLGAVHKAWLRLAILERTRPPFSQTNFRPISLLRENSSTSSMVELKVRIYSSNVFWTGCEISS